MREPMRAVQLSQRMDFDTAPTVLARRWAALRVQGADLIDLADSNPTHCGLGCPEVLDELARAASLHSAYRPAPLGALSAREALAATDGGDPDAYVLASSTSELYGWMLTLLCDPGDEIAVPQPGYPLLDALARLHDVRLVPYQLRYRHPDGWFADPTEFARLAARPRLRALVVVTPGNPTGSYVRPEERAAVVSACAEAGVVLIADEVFGRFPLEDQRQPALAGESACVTVALDGASKSLGSPQLKIGWARLSGLPAAECADFRRRLEYIADSVLSVSGPVQEALPGVLPFREQASARIRARCLENLRAARTFFESPQTSPYRVRRCSGGWSALVETPRPAEDEMLALAALDAGVRVYPGYFFDSPERGLFSISLLPPPDIFLEGCRRLRSAIDTLR